jgi:THO complex subunit 2
MRHTSYTASNLPSDIVNQLKSQNSIDLLVLRELISKMAGIEIVEDMTDAQYEALAGGETLKIEAREDSQIGKT